MNISIFGLGYVGCVSLGCLAQKGNKVIGVDVSETKVNQINSGFPTIIEKDIDSIIKTQSKAGNISATLDFKQAIKDTELSIIAVGTPSSDQGHLNLQYIFKVAEQIAQSLEEKRKFHIIAIRSTITPGTCEKFAEIIENYSTRKRSKDFEVISNPEFLREGTAVYDYFNPPLTLIGSENKEVAQRVATLYQDLPAEIVITETKISEIMKYVSNTFHALKVSFGNEIGNICQALQIDSHKVMDIFVKDKKLNISPYYLKPGFAYGGSCLPKDLKGLQTLAHDNYVQIPVIQSIGQTNEFQIQRAIDLIVKQGKRKLGFLGLSFKAGTDDLRNSPSVSVIETLLGKGYEIKIYDKNVHLSKLSGTNKEFIEKHIQHLSILIRPTPDEVIENSDILIVATKEFEFVEILKEQTEKPIIDLVRLGDVFLSKENYIGINW